MGPYLWDQSLGNDHPVINPGPWSLVDELGGPQHLVPTIIILLKLVYPLLMHQGLMNHKPSRLDIPQPDTLEIAPLPGYSAEELRSGRATVCAIRCEAEGGCHRRSWNLFLWMACSHSPGLELFFGIGRLDGFVSSSPIPLKVTLLEGDPQRSSRLGQRWATLPFGRV
jgi:hypothetical protein